MRRRRIFNVALALGITFASIAASSPASADDPLLSFTTVGTAVIEGVPPGPIVGNYVYASAGRWSPSPTAISYQWLLDGVPIDGATLDYYFPATPDFGHLLSVAVTGTRDGYESATTTSATALIKANASLTASYVTGAPRVGWPSSLTIGTTNPTDAQLTYQWRSAGVVIPSATSSTYTPQLSDLDKVLSVDVTVSAPGYVSRLYNLQASIRTLPSTMTAGSAVVGGIPAVGATVFAQYSGWTAQPTAYTYQWHVDGVDVADSTSQSYVPTAADVGKSLTVTVTGLRDQFDPAAATSAASSVVKPSFTHIPIPTITGTAAIGSPLTAHSTAWVPVATQYGFTWYLNGTVVGTGPTYTPSVGTQIGQTVTVTTTGISSKNGPATSGQSAPSEPIAAGVLTAGKVTFTLKPTTNGGACVDTTGWVGVHLSYQWYLSGVPSGGNSFCYSNIPVGDEGKTLSVTVTDSEAGLASVSTSSATVVIHRGSFSVGNGTIPMPVRIGSRITLDFGTWSPVPTHLVIHWHIGTNYSEPGPTISTSASFIVPSSYYGHHIFAVIQGSGGAPLNPSTTWTLPYLVGTGQFVTTPTPTIVGNAQVGSTVTAHRGTWSPSSSVHYAFQWYEQADSSATPVAIHGATSSTYKIPAMRVGELLSVRVTATKTHYSSVSTTSDPTAAVVVS